MTAEDQLRRLLALLPGIARGGEHRLEDVARTLNTSPDILLRDLHAISERTSDPPGWVENIQIFVEADRVSVNPTRHFRRPMRLTLGEWRAVELGLAMLRAERAPDERGVIEEALALVRECIAQEPEGESPIAATLGAEKYDGAVPALRTAIRERRRVEITYQKGADDAPGTRVICPLSFVVEQGVWYLVAQSDAAAIRVFRLDRVVSLRILAERFEPAGDVDLDALLTDGRAFVGEPPETLRVRYSAKVARWIAERERGTQHADGSFEAGYPLGDDAWAIRHVLQYGPEAEVLAPESVRAELVRRLRSVVDMR